MLASSRRHRRWKKINYRRTDTLLAAEFLHGLYQRHSPFLNPFRFANTAVVFRPWETSSYAPQEEWDRLALRFGTRFLEEPDRTCAELDRLFGNARPRSRALAEELDATSIVDLSDSQLAGLLVRMHHVPLGEIYEVNLVQVEHALHAAVAALVRRRVPKAAAERLLAQLSTSEHATVAGTADAAFLELVRQARRDGRTDPESYRRELERLVTAHAQLGSGYGAATVTYAGLARRFHQYVQLTDEELLARQGGGEQEGRAWLDEDPLAARLLAALRRTGDVRDQNKRLLGTVTRHRTALLADVARRRGVAVDDLRLYLLEELLRLVGERVQVPTTLIDRRRQEGVVLVRHEAMVVPDESSLPARMLHPGGGNGTRRETLRGLCASPGSYTGTARLVTSAADLERMGVGDVLVAPGTDFDLILLLRMAGAIVTEEGGLLSHAAVVARELAIPCLVGVVDAMSTIRDGALIAVDASKGLVTRLDTDGSRSDSTVASSPDWPDALVPLSADLPAERAGRKAAGLLTLARAGLALPDPVLVIPAEICARVADDLRRGDEGSGRRLSESVARRFTDTRLTLRSSSLAEDSADGTAAGIYHSEVDVTATAEEILPAIARVLASRTGERAKAYHPAGRHECPMAILVAPYQVFDYQGTAVSHSPWDPDQVMVEYAESDGRGGCPDVGGEVVHFPRQVLEHGWRSSPFAHLYHDLAQVASATLGLAEQMSGPVEVEWGACGHAVTFLQVRRLVVDGARADREVE